MSINSTPFQSQKWLGLNDKFYGHPAHESPPTQHVWVVNSTSSFTSGFCMLLLFWTATHFIFSHLPVNEDPGESFFDSPLSLVNPTNLGGLSHISPYWSRFLLTLISGDILIPMSPAAPRAADMLNMFLLKNLQIPIVLLPLVNQSLSSKQPQIDMSHVPSYKIIHPSLFLPGFGSEPYLCFFS